MKLFRVFLAALALLSCAGCASVERRPLPTVPKVDLTRFMGNWYVIGVIPTRFEKEAHNAVESYSLNPDGTIATTFTFRKGSFDGPLKQYHPKGFVTPDPSNAVWGMQFVWPIKAEYLIVHLDDAYTTTVVARNKRDHAWIMSRTPTMPEGQYLELVQLLVSWGYDEQSFVRVPQRW
jgi:apolipoprotein D and lipocalin family protein